MVGEEDRDEELLLFTSGLEESEFFFAWSLALKTDSREEEKEDEEERRSAAVFSETVSIKFLQISWHRFRSSGWKKSKIETREAEKYDEDVDDDKRG